ncbi:MAG: glutathione S-transferase family protein [Kofleriaceae bacterium]
MKLYGTTGSPFVRRVRVVAAEVGEPVDLVLTANDVGQAALREVSPIRKVPVAIIDGKTLFDSRVIIEYLTLTRGWGTMAPPRDRWRELNLVNAIDSALDSVIQLFYLKRDNLTADNNHAFGRRQIERADSIFTWLAAQLADDRTFESGFGLAEISAICALDWMEFRDQYATADRLASLRAAWALRPSLASTKPHA